MNDMPSAPLIAAEEVRSNFIKSFVLVGIIIALVIAASYLIGYMLNDIKSGLFIGAVVSVIVIPLQIMTAKWMILAMTSGRAANPNDLRERRAIHIVEGLAVSAGLQRTPDLYIIPSRIPNAFASGMDEKSAFIGVTQGLLDMMDDQELEGVIAHEVGHIIHRDIMLNQLVVGLISVLLILALIIERIGIIGAYSGGNRRGRDRDNGNAGGAAALLLLLAILIRPLVMLIGTLLQLGISRKREYAADAVAVRLCSYNEGLARALEKLGGEEYSSDDIKELGGENMACMYINFP
ncbi:MAG: M48 family metalloprotease, partial [Lentisphaeria bacterium]|nr:M48 family metalloprotease [Lentisphaeria bacterium]